MTNRPRRKSDAARRANQVIRGRTMLIMLLLCSAARAVRSAPEARVAVQMQKPPAAQEVFPYAGMDAQNRSSTTFSGGTSSSAGLCMNIFMYLNEEA